jgi:hypothetical protein
MIIIQRLWKWFAKAKRSIGMPIIDTSIIHRLIEIEGQVHYGELPPPGVPPFVSVLRNSKIIISAPHGAITYRNNGTDLWHEEDEYTASIALLLSELCNTSVIASIWRTEESDPNEHDEKRSTYKQTLRHIVDARKPLWLIDLHGAREDSPNLASTQKVDLGIGEKSEYLPEGVNNFLINCIEKRLEKGVTSRVDKSGFPAGNEHRIAAFAKRKLDLSSVQLEMKPSVRIPLRRIDASMYSKVDAKYSGPYSAPQENVIAMLQALADFISYLHEIPSGDERHAK